VHAPRNVPLTVSITDRDDADHLYLTQRLAHGGDAYPAGPKRGADGTSTVQQLSGAPHRARTTSTTTA